MKPVYDFTGQMLTALATACVLVLGAIMVSADPWWAKLFFAILGHALMTLTVRAIVENAKVTK